VEDSEMETRERRAGEIGEDTVNGYFAQHNFALAKASGRTLADLNWLPDKGIAELMRTLPIGHEKQRQRLLQKYEANFVTWAYQLRFGFNLCFYGFGSKIDLLLKFARTCLKDGPVVHVKGFLPLTTIRQVLTTISDGVLKLHAPYRSPLHYVHLIRDAMSNANASSPSTPTRSPSKASQPRDPLYIVVHNIDGPGLQLPEAQEALSQLASIPNVHLVASVDHINAPLLWDRGKACRLQFSWHEVPTYVPYSEKETKDTIGGAGSGVTGESNERAALVVLRGLTPNARKIFKLLAEYQLENPEQQGLSFQDLYTECRDVMLASTELSLRNMLTQLKDHQLIRSRASNAGADRLYVPLQEHVVKRVLAELEAMDKPTRKK